MSLKDKEKKLFHYTSAKGLTGIITNQKIWATAYHCTNDRSEFTYSKEILDNLFRAAISSRFPIAETKDIEKLIKKLNFLVYSKLVQNFFEHPSFNHLIICFTSESDDPDVNENGLLSQWRGYGKDGGYAIQFDRESLNFEKENIGKVVYGFHNKNEWTEKVLKNYIIPWCHKFDNFDDIRPDSFIPKNNRKTLDLLCDLCEMAVFTKNPHFKEENEYRYLLTVRSNSRFNYLDRDGLIVPYVPVDIDATTCIKRIIVGPSGRVDDRVRSVKMLLKSKKLDIKVTKSAIPYDKG